MLGCFSRRRRPAGDAPPPVPQCDVESASTSSTMDSTSPCSSSSVSVGLIKDGVGVAVASSVRRDDGGGGVGKDPSAALSDPGLSSAIASRRFFLAGSPGRSNSIVDSSGHAVVGAAGVAVPTYSPDPHADFLSSMEEMAAALRLDPRRRGDSARLHELLLCYLALNHKSTHKYIVSAFTDLLLHLTATDEDDDEHGLPE